MLIGKKSINHYEIIMYYQIYKNILSPFYERVVKKRRILDHLSFLEESQWWSREDILSFQWEELTKLLGHAYRQCPYWKEVFQQRQLTPNDIKTPEDFYKLPLTSKEDIRLHKKRMVANNYIGKTWTKSTGGSTGIPLELDYTPQSYDWRMAATKRGYGWAGCADGIKQAYIWGTDIGEVSFKTQLKRRIHYSLLRHKYFNCFSFTEEKMAECIKGLNRYRPDVLLGYTNPLYNFACYIEKNKSRLTFRPKNAITAAEKLHDYQREKISKVFGCPVFNTYGSREFMLIASESETHEGLLTSAENLFVEVIKEDGTPAKEGEIGELVVTDLHNYGMPFIRYKIGDLAIYTEKQCSSGRGLPMLKDVVGRSLDMILTPDGRFVPGEFFPHLMKEFRGVLRFQVIQNDLDHLTIKIIRNEELTDADFEFMKKEIKKVMGGQINIHFDMVKDIPLTKTGKFRVTVSNLK